MIAAPINDHACLGPTTDHVVAEIDAGNPALVDLAAQFATTEELAAWFRTLPQRDDHGAADEGPKITACHPAQRLQLDNPEPNCFERSARFIGAAEMIDPTRVYRLETIVTPNGLHTFPRCDGVPVILDPTVARNGRASPRIDFEVPVAVRRLRIQRLLGLDETKGVRGDLARARRAKELGYTQGLIGSSSTVDDDIAKLEAAMARYESILAELDAIEEAEGADDVEDAESTEDRPPVRNGVGVVSMTPVQAIDLIAELAMHQRDGVVDGVQRIYNGHRAMCGVLKLRPICMADIHDVALVLALAQREAQRRGLGELKLVYTAAWALDALDQAAAIRTSMASTMAKTAAMRAVLLPSRPSTPSTPSTPTASTPSQPARNDVFTDALGALVGNQGIQQLVGGLARVAGRLVGGVGVEAAKVKLAKAGVGAPILTALEKELNREGLTLGAFAKPSPMVGSLDSMTPQALAGRWLANKF